MLNLKKLLVLSSLLSTTLFTSISHASEQTLATISNDDSKNTYQLIVDSTADNRAIKIFYKDVYLNGKKTSREALDFHVLIHSGMILEQRDKYIVMRLKSDNFDEQQGGIITVDTLYNGANGTRKAYDMSLAKDKFGWTLMNQGKIVKQIFIQTNKVMLLGSVGIKNLVMK
ncbi:MAG: hypothetical protein H7281_11660 [Bacteriovorax sp.]|nr:hypothetical protein [Bacteriovorax sp.]